MQPNADTTRRDRNRAPQMLAMLFVAVGVTGCGGSKTIVVPQLPAAPAAAAVPVAAAPAVPTSSVVAVAPTTSVVSTVVTTVPNQTPPPPVTVIKIVKIIKIIQPAGTGQPIPGETIPRQDGSVKIIKIVKIIRPGPDWQPVPRPWPCRHHGWRRHHPHGPCRCPPTPDPAVASAPATPGTTTVVPVDPNSQAVKTI